MSEAVKSICCKEFSCSEAKKVGDKVMEDFRNVVERKQVDDSTMELIDEFEKHQHKNKHKIFALYEKKTAVYLEDRPIVWAYAMYVQCNSKYIHTFPLTTCKNFWKNKKKI